MVAQQLLPDLDLAATLEVFGSGAFLYDRRCKLLAVNQQGLDMLGFGSLAEVVDEVEGRTQRVRIATLDGVPCVDPRGRVRRALAGERLVEDFERVDPCNGGPQVVLRISIVPMLDRRGEVIGALKLLHDVTTEYELAQRKREFTRVTAHELRTPATVLRLHAQRLLRGQPTSTERARGSAEAIDRATRRIETLALKLQDIATVSAGRPIPIEPHTFRLDSLVADVVQSLQPDESARVNAQAAPVQVLADPTRLRAVIEALLDNALRYSEAPATVDVRVGEHDGHAELSVADKGIGIPQEKQPHLFEQFYRAHTDTPFDRGGLGASLYLADHIIKQHGGRIWFESKEGEGTTFHLGLRRS
jgi:signal transduction histidine kinase